MSKEYLTFVPSLADLTEREAIQLTIRDLTPGPRKYDARVVRALVSADPSRLPEGDRLWVRSWIGVPYPKPWAIQIVEEVGECEPGLPHGETLRA